MIAINKKGEDGGDQNYRIRTKARKSARAAGVAAAAAPAPPLQLHSCTVALLCSFHALRAATLLPLQLHCCTVVQLLCTERCYFAAAGCTVAQLLCACCTGMCVTSVVVKLHKMCSCTDLCRPLHYSCTTVQCRAEDSAATTSAPQCLHCLHSNSAGALCNAVQIV